MRYWIDTEFIDDGRSIELISLGVVAEDGRTYYAQSDEFDARRCDAWVRANVLPHLEPAGAPSWRSRARIAGDLRAFVDPEPEFWAYHASYDWVVVSQLFGPLTDRPRGWPTRCRDVAELAALFPAVGRPPEPEPAHHALADARWVAAYWRELVAARGATP